MIGVSFMGSIFGGIGLAATRAGLVRVGFPIEAEEGFLESLTRRLAPAGIVKGGFTLPAAVRQITEYFEGSRRSFDLPLDIRSSPFQRRVLEETARIPFGETRSYGEIARRTGSPAAARAVGSALRTNPLPIVIPCHRVIGADGSLVGFAGGIDLKAALIEHERILEPTRPRR